MKLRFLLLVGVGIFIWWLSATVEDYTSKSSSRIEETHANQSKLLQSAIDR